jgi:hypothetical protein
VRGEGSELNVGRGRGPEVTSDRIIDIATSHSTGDFEEENIDKSIEGERRGNIPLSV